MAKGKSGETETSQRWGRWIREWRSSGLSVRAFCKLHGLAEPSFYAWRRLLDRRQAQAVAFVPVQVVPEERRISGSALEVVLSGERMVRVAPGFDAQTLTRLLAVLEEKPC